MKETNYIDYLDSVQQFSLMHEEPLWMMEFRKSALTKINSLELPSFERVKYQRWPLLQVPDLFSYEEGIMLAEDFLKIGRASCRERVF